MRIINQKPTACNLEQKQARSYDETPYANLPSVLTHVDRFAVNASLMGMNPAPIKSCRVLEIGCAFGQNIIPMACCFKESQFVGIDISAVQVSGGQTIIKELELENIEIRKLSVLDADEKLGLFDYIIVHGVYSWVPDATKGQILEISQKLLKPQGIVFISYNTYPGWHFDQMLREMMIYHTDSIAEPSPKVGQARLLLEFLTKAQTGNDNLKSMMQKEVESLGRRPDYYLLHEYLEAVNDPVYFHEFAASAEQHGLQYVADSQFGVGDISNLPPDVYFMLRRFSTDVIRTEQYSDFVNNRKFRHSLLCKDNVALTRACDPELISQFFVALPSKLLGENAEQELRESNRYTLANGITMHSLKAPLTNAIQILYQSWPQSLPFLELVDRVRGSLAEEVKDLPATLAAALLRLYAKQAVSFQTVEDQFVSSVSGRPQASSLSRYQAKSQIGVTNQKHETVNLSALTHQVLLLLDGRRSKEAIVDQLLQLNKNGSLSLGRNGKVDSNELSRLDISLMLDQTLISLCENALLVS